MAWVRPEVASKTNGYQFDNREYSTRAAFFFFLCAKIGFWGTGAHYQSANNITANISCMHKQASGNYLTSA